MQGRLQDTTLEIFDQSGRSIAFNDNWRDSQQSGDIEASGVAPTDDRESAVFGTITPGAYTAVIRGANDTQGIGLVEFYDLEQTSDSHLVNISTRAKVEQGDDVLIGGFIAVGQAPQKFVARAIGPSLNVNGAPVEGRLQDTTLEVRNGNGDLLIANDNWRSSQRAEIESTGLAPADDRESAAVGALGAGGYTAIVRGKDGSTGIGLVEIYNVGNP